MNGCLRDERDERDLRDSLFPPFSPVSPSAICAHRAQSAMRLPVIAPQSPVVAMNVPSR